MITFCPSHRWENSGLYSRSSLRRCPQLLHVGLCAQQLMTDPEEKQF